MQLNNPRAPGNGGHALVAILSLGMAAWLAPPVRAAAATEAVSVLRAVTPAPPPGAPTAAIYLTLRNDGVLADRLLAVSTPVAGQAMIHSERIEGGVMRMQAEPALELRPGTTLAMHAGGTHVMLADLRRSLVAGERFALLLRFAQAGEVRTEVTVLPLGSRP